MTYTPNKLEEALTLLNSMVKSGESHSTHSQGLLKSARSEVAVLRTELDEAKASEEGALMVLATERAELHAALAEIERMRSGISSAMESLEQISGGWVPDAVIEPVELLRQTLEGSTND